MPRRSGAAVSNRIRTPPSAPPMSATSRAPGRWVLDGIRFKFVPVSVDRPALPNPSVPVVDHRDSQTSARNRRRIQVPGKSA